MEPNELAEKAISKMNKIITDEIFLLIQNDHELMHDYLRTVEENGLDRVNQQIGKSIKRIYHLDDFEDRENNPRSTLIQSYQKFK